MEKLSQARTMLKAIGWQGPIYLLADSGLTPTERGIIGYSPATVAYTSPVADLWYRRGALADQWTGRGLAVVFVRPPEDRTLDQVLGTTLHEAGHFASYANRPDRSDADPDRALEYSREHPCDAGNPHDERWLRACVCLWDRAAEAGYNIPFGRVVVLEQYGLTRDQLSAAMREASGYRGLSIGQLERKLFPAEPTPTVKAFTPWSTFITIRGELVQCHPSGVVERLPDLYGRGGCIFKSMRDFLAFRDVERWAG